MRTSRGFSLIELLLVIGLMATVAGIAVPVSSGFITRMRADSGVATALTVLQAARARAIAERRNVQVNFLVPNRITVVRLEVPGPATTVLEDVRLSENLSFTKFVSIPDTPDAFGASGAIQFSGTLPVMFTSDGSFIDANGDVVNGTVFFGRGSETTTARAITLFGVSGFVRAWKWSGTAWLQ